MAEGDNRARYGDTTIGYGGLESSLVTGTEGANNAILWTSAFPGTDGDDTTIAIVDPAGNNVALSVDVTGTDIEVTSATDGSSAITSTAQDVIDLINADDAANDLVIASNSGDSTGAGLVVAVAATNLADGEDAEAGATASIDREIGPGVAKANPTAMPRLPEDGAAASGRSVVYASSGHKDVLPEHQARRNALPHITTASS